MKSDHVGNSLEVGSRGPSLQLAFGSLGASRRKKGSRANGFSSIATLRQLETCKMTSLLIPTFRTLTNTVNVSKSLKEVLYGRVMSSK
eukprot:scaffold1815_cov147-Skeletonema_dohrnii-CCMP3373.AAC.24